MQYIDMNMKNIPGYFPINNQYYPYNLCGTYLLIEQEQKGVLRVEWHN